MRALSLLFGVALLIAACNNNTVSTTPTTPAAPTASFAGTWVGSATDSTGSFMGSGFGNTETMTLVLTQSDNQVTGNMSFAGFFLTPTSAPPTFTGTITGNTLAFTAAMPASSMPAPNGSCSASANGTLTMNAAGNQMTGTFSGSSTCVGGFSNGQMTLTRQ